MCANVLSLFTPGKQKSRGFLMLLGGIERRLAANELTRAWTRVLRNTV